MNSALSHLYRPSLALLNDLYELTMAYGYWKLGRAEEPAAFELTFRKQPFGSGFALAAGLADVIAFVNRLHFDDDDLAYLGGLSGSDGSPLFEAAFLDYLKRMTFACDIEAAVEGAVVFAHEPIIQVTGPLLQAQILETPLLNLMNFPTLVATKAARICHAAEGDPVVEFGLRRAQGPDGGVTASRASYLGGCAATSNLLAGRLFDIPVKGTHAHSWVMSYERESQAFEHYARVLPHASILLVDTYDTLRGVRRAAEVGQRMKQQGRTLGGVRLDSGDLAYLSSRSREILDDAGLSDTKILASGDLDEHVIQSLKQQAARIDLWGVGTKLAVAYDQPALGGVYKLGAIGRHRPDGSNPPPSDRAAPDATSRNNGWRETIKLSEQVSKVNTPGLLRVRRYFHNGHFMADMIYDQRFEPPDHRGPGRSDASAARAARDPPRRGARADLPRGKTGLPAAYA